MTRGTSLSDMMVHVQLSLCTVMLNRVTTAHFQFPHQIDYNSNLYRNKDCSTEQLMGFSLNSDSLVVYLYSLSLVDSNRYEWLYHNLTDLFSRILESSHNSPSSMRYKLFVLYRSIVYGRYRWTKSDLIVCEICDRFTDNSRKFLLFQRC